MPVSGRMTGEPQGGTAMRAHNSMRGIPPSAGGPATIAVGHRALPPWPDHPSPGMIESHLPPPLTAVPDHIGAWRCERVREC